jgi:heat shock transcription factor 1
MIPTIDIVIPQPAQNAANNVPAFLAKLWQMVNDARTDNIISWSPDGRSFVIHDQTTFAQTQLPYYYKHSNMSSFVRQLNMYDFHKVVGVESGGLKSEKQEEMEFQHQFFLKGMKGLLTNIKRKVSSANRGAQFLPNLKTEKVNEVLNEVNLIRDKQEDLDSKLNAMKTENEALWREVVNLRQKHQKQQQIVNKLIQFLMSMVQPGMAPAVKRRYQSQLAIEGLGQGGGGGGGKKSKLEEASNALSATVTTGEYVAVGSPDSGSGPNIRDVTHEVQQQLQQQQQQQASSSIATFTVDSLVRQQPSAAGSSTTTVNIELPDTPEVQPSTSQPPSFLLRANSPVHTPAAMRAVNPTHVSPAISIAAPSNSAAAAASTTVVAPTRPVLRRGLSKEDLDMETTFTQREIDKLQEVFSGQVNFDPTLLSTLFNPEEPLSSNLIYGVPAAASAEATSTSGIANAPLRLQMDRGGASTSTALTPATPSLLELADIDDDTAAATNPSQDEEDLSVDALDTPLVFADDTNPLTTQIKK